jgi:Chitobiase/beta-hexosaminidase C-terminal domain
MSTAKSFFASTVLVAIAAFAAPAFAQISITTPSNGAQVTSPFTLVASTTTCAGVPAVSMGYSIDNGATVSEPTSFSASVTASAGPHVLKVKCWGKQASSQTNVNITVAAATTPPTTPPPTTGSDIIVSSPANGASVTAPFTLAAKTTTCAGVPATSMGYSIDGGSTTSAPAAFSVALTKNLGTHTIAVKCYGQNAQDQVSLSVRVVPPPTASTPKFSLAPGTYSTTQYASISDATAGATIYYTTDGSGPSTSSPVYAGPITVSHSMALQAIAVAPGYTNSGMALASYTIQPPSKASIPSNAIQVNEVQNLPNWRTKYDPATNGTASGVMTQQITDPSLSGQAAQFDTTSDYYGGVLYSVTYDNDPNATNFVYDAQVWIEAGSSIGNLEMDNNQVIPNGDTVIYSFQCSGNAGVWEFGANTGTRTNGSAKWVKSTAPCNPAQWATNAWHHVQISYSRDNVGNITYHSVWLDGVESPINATVFGAFSLGWGSGILVANFQVDGTAATGSSTLYLDNLTMSRW